MSEVEKKYYRLCFSISPMSLFSNMEMKEQGLDEESDDITVSGSGEQTGVRPDARAGDWHGTVR